MFDTKISIFRSFTAVPETKTLGGWIAGCMKDGHKYAAQVKQYRETGKEELKKSLPLATVGAVFTGEKNKEKYPKPGSGYRVKEQIKTRTGWIALDVDAGDNPHLEDAAAVRDAIARFVYVPFAGLSVSGKGVWALVKVEDPEKQDLYFEQLQIDFKSRGIILDSSKGKNPNDARFYSFDPAAYVADDFEIYDRLPVVKPKPKKKAGGRTFQRTSYTSKPGETRAKVEKLIAKIDTDITGGYKKWSQLGFALEDEFGESGRDYFHDISQYHPEYNRRECDWRYDSCLKSNGAGTTIGTFFYECKKHGFTLDRNQGPQRDNRLNGKCETKKLRQNGNDTLKGYPDAWDEITLEKGSQEYKEATVAMISDASPAELNEFYNLN
jgi:hypothetical protein